MASNSYASQDAGYTDVAVERPQIAVSPAGADRLLALASVFGRAFVDEPMMRWPMGETPNPIECFTRCFAFFLDAVLELGLVSEADNASGAAVWIPPDGGLPRGSFRVSDGTG